MMSDNIAIFMVLVVSIAAAVSLVLASAWMRRTRLQAAGPSAQVAHLAAENEVLREQVHRLEQQLGVADRIASAGPQRVAVETQMLR
jgi:cell division protein FtsB